MKYLEELILPLKSYIPNDIYSQSDIVASKVFQTLIVLSFLFDGFFDPIEYLLACVIIITIYNYYLWRNKLNFKPRALYILTIFYLSVSIIAVFMSIDKGSAILEFYRTLGPFIIMLIFLHYRSDELESFYNLVFFCGVIVAMVSLTALGTDFLISEGMREGRLQGIFQYANTTAVLFLISYIFGFWGLVRNNNKVVLYLIGIYFCTIGLILTGSRMAYLMWPLAIFLSLLLASKNEKALWGILAPIASLSTIPFVLLIKSQYFQGNIKLAYLYLVIGLAVFILISSITHKIVTTYSRLNRYAANAIPVLLLALLVGTVILNSSRPFSISSPEVQERLAYYNDALIVIRDFPLLGVGGGGWASIHNKYQTALYNSSLVHNQFLQISLDTGIITLLVFLGLTIYTLCLGYRAGKNGQRDYNKYSLVWPPLVIVVVMSLHSLLDIDMVYPAIAYIFFALLAVPVIIVRSFNPKPKIEYISKTTKWQVTVISLVLIIGALILWQARIFERRADLLITDRNIDEATVYYQKSLSLNPLSAKTYNKLGEAYENSRNNSHVFLAAEAFKTANRLSPYDPVYLSNLAYNTYSQKDYLKSMQYYYGLIDINPLNRSNYENLAYVLVALGEKEEDQEKKRDYFKSTIEIRNMLQREKEKINPRAWKLKHKPDLEVSPHLYFKLGQAQYYLGLEEESKKSFGQALKNRDVRMEMLQWVGDKKINSYERGL